MCSGNSLSTIWDNISVPSSRVKKSNLFTLEDGTDMFSRKRSQAESFIYLRY